MIKKPWAYKSKIVGFIQDEGPRFLNQVPTYILSGVRLVNLGAEDRVGSTGQVVILVVSRVRVALVVVVTTTTTSDVVYADTKTCLLRPNRMPNQCMLRSQPKPLTTNSLTKLLNQGLQEGFQ